MPKQVALLRSLAVIAAASLLFSMPSAAPASQRADGKMDAKTRAARMHHVRQREAKIPPKIYGAAPDAAGCARPYRNEFPPCMSTWPSGDPNFHGDNGY